MVADRSAEMPTAPSLPVKGSLTLAYTVSMAVAVAAVIASAAGLLYPSAVYPTPDLLRAFRPNDVANLVVGMPALLGSMGLARRSALVGLLLWPGALFYVLYNYLIPLFCLPLNMAFLLELSLVTFSVYTIIGLVGRIDATLVKHRLAGAVRERIGGGVLAGAGVLIFARVIGVLVSAIVNRTGVSSTDLATDVADFLMSPALIVGGVQLWRRKAQGYVTGLGLLFLVSLLFVGLVVFMVARPLTTGERLVLSQALVITVMGLIFLVPFGLFLRGAVVDRHLSEPDEDALCPSEKN